MADGAEREDCDEPAGETAGQPSQEQVAQIAYALASGRKIEAIKIYRNATGRDLKAAKEFIEALIPRLKEQDPERFSQSGGCASVVLFCIAAISAAGFWIIRCLT